jgi:FkbM family methyltransferase
MSGQLIFDRPPVRIKMCKHGAMIYYASDAFVGRSLDLYGEYSEFETELFRQVMSPGAIVVDAGANFGAFTLYFANAVGPMGRVYAFEPQRSLFHILCGNLALNGLANVTAVHAALGGQSGTTLVPAVDYATDGNFGGIALATGAAGERVDVRTIDGLRLPHCRLLKIDVEGMEIEVLAGASETLARCQPFLYVENDRPAKSAELIQWLLDRGYRLFWHLPRMFNADNYFGNPNNIFPGLVSINMFCIPGSLDLKMTGFHQILSPQDDWHDACEPTRAG